VHVLVNDVRLFVDVANLGLIPDCHGMRQKPTVLMLHGGPGFGHVPSSSPSSPNSDASLGAIMLQRASEFAAVVGPMK
jgi:hypothetical protein